MSNKLQAWAKSFAIVLGFFAVVAYFTHNITAAIWLTVFFVAAGLAGFFIT